MSVSESRGCRQATVVPGFTRNRSPRATPVCTRTTALHPQVQLMHQLVVRELVPRTAFVFDPAVDDHVATIGDPDRLVEVLLGHEHREAIAILELADLVYRVDDQERREADRRLVDQQDPGCR